MHAIIRDATNMVNFSGFLRHYIIRVNFFDRVDGSVGKMLIRSHDIDRQAIVHLHHALEQ